MANININIKRIRLLWWWYNICRYCKRWIKKIRLRIMIRIENKGEYVYKGVTNRWELRDREIFRWI